MDVILNKATVQYLLHYIVFFATNWHWWWGWECLSPGNWILWSWKEFDDIEDRLDSSHR